MTEDEHPPPFEGIPPVNGNMTPVETARYTGEMLAALRKIAASQGQGVLAHLLELARYEAHTLTIMPMTPDSPDGGSSAQPVPVPAER